MHQPVDGCSRGHRVLEDPFPLRERKIAGQQYAAAFVSLRQQGEQHFHFLSTLLDVAHLIDYQAVMAAQLLDLFAQLQVALGHQKTLRQQGATCVLHCVGPGKILDRVGPEKVSRSGITDRAAFQIAFRNCKAKDMFHRMPSGKSILVVGFGR